MVEEQTRARSLTYALGPCQEAPFCADAHILGTGSHIEAAFDGTHDPMPVKTGAELSWQGAALGGPRYYQEMESKSLLQWPV